MKTYRPKERSRHVVKASKKEVMANGCVHEVLDECGLMVRYQEGTKISSVSPTCTFVTIPEIHVLESRLETSNSDRDGEFLNQLSTSIESQIRINMSQVARTARTDQLIQLFPYSKGT